MSNIDGKHEKHQVDSDKIATPHILTATKEVRRWSPVYDKVNDSLWSEPACNASSQTRNFEWLFSGEYRQILPIFSPIVIPNIKWELVKSIKDKTITLCYESQELVDRAYSPVERFKYSIEWRSSRELGGHISQSSWRVERRRIGSSPMVEMLLNDTDQYAIFREKFNQLPIEIASLGGLAALGIRLDKFNRIWLKQDSANLRRQMLSKLKSLDGIGWGHAILLAEVTSQIDFPFAPNRFGFDILAKLDTAGNFAEFVQRQAKHSREQSLEYIKQFIKQTNLLTSAFQIVESLYELNPKVAIECLRIIREHEMWREPADKLFWKWKDELEHGERMRTAVGAMGISDQEYEARKEIRKHSASTWQKIRKPLALLSASIVSAAGTYKAWDLFQDKSIPLTAGLPKDELAQYRQVAVIKLPIIISESKTEILEVSLNASFITGLSRERITRPRIDIWQGSNAQSRLSDNDVMNAVRAWLKPELMNESIVSKFVVPEKSVSSNGAVKVDLYPEGSVVDPALSEIGKVKATLGNQILPVIYHDALWFPQKRVDRKFSSSISYTQDVSNPALPVMVVTGGSMDGNELSEETPQIIHSLIKGAEGQLKATFRFKISDPRLKALFLSLINKDLSTVVLPDIFSSVTVESCYRAKDGELITLGTATIRPQDINHPYFAEVNIDFTEGNYDTFCNELSRNNAYFRIVSSCSTDSKLYKRGKVINANCTANTLEFSLGNNLINKRESVLNKLDTAWNPHLSENLRGHLYAVALLSDSIIKNIDDQNVSIVSRKLKQSLTEVLAVIADASSENAGRSLYVYKGSTQGSTYVIGAQTNVSKVDISSIMQQQKVMFEDLPSLYSIGQDLVLDPSIVPYTEVEALTFVSYANNRLGFSDSSRTRKVLEKLIEVSDIIDSFDPKDIAQGQLVPLLSALRAEIIMAYRNMLDEKRSKEITGVSITIFDY